MHHDYRQQLDAINMQYAQRVHAIYMSMQTRVNMLVAHWEMRMKLLQSAVVELDMAAARGMIIPPVYHQRRHEVHAQAMHDTQVAEQAMLHECQVAQHAHTIETNNAYAALAQLAGGAYGGPHAPQGAPGQRWLFDYSPAPDVPAIQATQTDRLSNPPGVKEFVILKLGGVPEVKADIKVKDTIFGIKTKMPVVYRTVSTKHLVARVTYPPAMERQIVHHVEQCGQLAAAAAVAAAFAGGPGAAKAAFSSAFQGCIRAKIDANLAEITVTVDVTTGERGSWTPF